MAYKFSKSLVRATILRRIDALEEQANKAMIAQASSRVNPMERFDEMSLAVRCIAGINELKQLYKVFFEASEDV